LEEITEITTANLTANEDDVAENSRKLMDINERLKTIDSDKAESKAI
jgi:hypothetical protein